MSHGYNQDKIEDKTDDALALIEGFKEYSNNGHDMGAIKAVMNAHVDLDRVAAKFSDIMEREDSIKAQRLLDLLEFFTVCCQDKMFELIKHEKILTRISYGLYDPYLADHVLNLLKMWNDRFHMRSKEAKDIFELIENLPLYEFELPQYYRSRYEEEDTNQSNNSNNNNNNNKRIVPQEIIDSIRQIQNESKMVFNDANFDKMLPETRRNKLKSMMDRLKSLFSNLEMIEASPIWEILKDKLEPPHQEAQVLYKRLEFMHQQIKESISIEYGPQLPGKDGNYKILVSPVSMPKMEINELIEYKTKPCPKGQTCPYAPKMNNDNYIMGQSMEYVCSDFHSPFDRRRNFSDDSGEYAYKAAACLQKLNCPKVESCHVAHNYFEYNYHPQRYKRFKCKRGESCILMKFCPFYHTTDEGLEWLRDLNIFFKDVSTKIQYSEPDDEDFFDIISNNDANPDSGSFMIGASLRHVPPGASSFSGANGAEPNHLPSFGNQNQVELEEDNSKKYLFELKSKLSIKKSFKSPSDLSGLFLENSQNGGYPLFVSFEN